MRRSKPCFSKNIILRTEKKVSVRLNVVCSSNQKSIVRFNFSNLRNFGTKRDTTKKLKSNSVKDLAILSRAF